MGMRLIGLPGCPSLSWAEPIEEIAGSPCHPRQWVSARSSWPVPRLLATF